MNSVLKHDFAELAATASCFGIAANKEFILISAYGEGKNPELVMYKKR